MVIRTQRWLRRETSNGYIFYDTETRQAYRDGSDMVLITSSDIYSPPTFDSRAPLKVYFDFSYLCNLECRHCITNSSPRVDRQNELPADRIAAIMDELASVGVLEIAVGGGEPLVYPELYTLLDHAGAAGLNVVLTTNGHLITTETARRLKDVQVFEVRVSFDGSQAVHDYIRGPGAYRKALDAVRFLVQQGLIAIPRVTVCNDDLDGLDSLFEDLAATGASTIKAGLLEQKGRAALEENLELSRYPRDGTTARYLHTLARKHSLELKLPDDLASCFEFADGGDLRQGEHRSCGAGLVTAYISPYGNVQPCSSLPNWVIGNIGTDSFMNVWTNSCADKWHRCASTNGAWRCCINQDSDCRNP